MNFRVGQKVVCVNDEPTNHPQIDPNMDGLRKGSVYTIRWCGVFVHNIQDPYFGIRLQEIFRGDEDVPYGANRFRPVVERKTETGMAILREILDRENHQDRAPMKASRTEDPITR